MNGSPSPSMPDSSMGYWPGLPSRRLIAANFGCGPRFPVISPPFQHLADAGCAHFAEGDFCAGKDCPRPDRSKVLHLRDFRSPAICEFFNTICQFQTFGGSCGSTNLHHPQVISCASRAEWNAGDYHD